MNRVRTGAFVLGGLLVALVLAGVVSNFAATSPDGLDATARRGCTVDGSGEITGGKCMARSEQDHEVGGPLAEYGIRGIDNAYLSTALAGAAGVLLTFAIGGGLFWLARRRPPAGRAPARAPGRAPARAPGQAPGRTPARAPARAPGQDGD